MAPPILKTLPFVKLSRHGTTAVTFLFSEERGQSSTQRQRLEDKALGLREEKRGLSSD